MLLPRFTKEMKNESAGLLAALFIGIAPGYISRSVAGSYDNEAIAIFLLMFTFYLWIKALKQGSAFFGTLAALFYFYMVAAWGQSFCSVNFSANIDWVWCFRRLRFHYQYDSSPFVNSPSNGPLHEPTIRCLFIMVRRRNTCQHASSFCGFPASKNQ